MKKKSLQTLLAILLTCTINASPRAEDEKLLYYRSVLDQGLRDNDPKQIAEGYYLMGKYEERKNNFTEAYRLYFNALSINERIGDQEKSGRAYLRISALELKQKNLEKAKQYGQEAIRIASQHNLQDGLMSAFNQMGNIYLEYTRRADSTKSIPSLDSALHYLKKTAKLAASEKREYELAKSKFKLGLLYRQKKEGEKAIENLAFAARISKTKTQSETVEFHTNLASALTEFGKPSEAEKVLSESQDMIDRGFKIKPLHETHHYFTYAQYYEAIAAWGQAIELNTKAFATLSQLHADERKAHFPARLEATLKSQQRDLLLKISSMETEAKQSTISRQQLAMAFFAIFITALALLSWFLYRSYQKQKSLSKKNEFLIREQYHRVKNNLQVISSMLSLQHDHLTDEASKATLSESQTRINSMMLLHRQLYENDNVELIDIGAFFQEIINSVALTFGINDFRVRLDIGEEFLETDTATSIGAVVNELAMNSFKHAFVNTEPLIELSTRKTSDTIEIMYKDSGNTNIGTVFDNPGKQGFGLALIEMILYQINGKMKYRFENGSVFTITFKP